MLIEALVEEGKLPEAQAELARARAAKDKALDRDLVLDILAARVRGGSKKPGDMRAAARSLADIAQRADGAGFLVLARAADLQRGRLLVASGDSSGRALLAAVEKEAERRGLGQLASRAREARDTNGRM
jgi:hypothetical protein